MSDFAIRVEGLSKLYRIGRRPRYTTLRDVITDAISGSMRRIAGSGRHPSSNGVQRPDTNHEYVWAMQDVSFEVKRGEVVGIIGRNGAGKSTLLKILSRITEPTEGYAELHGRVGSLLEVGSGFHPELTGRENIVLNGIILGMKKGEIDRKFNEIVAFAEVEKFIDTPVKHYSSGMYMRLAFAVAAHLEPEILIVDEVLAVGDAAFQKKCLGKMGDVAKEGRTVLFVSHNMAAVQSLCNRVIWVHDGKIVEQGPPGQVVSSYLQTSFSTLTEQVWKDAATAPGNDMVRLHRARVRPTSGSPTDPITVRTPFVMEFEYQNLVPDTCLVLSLHLYNEQGILVFNVGAVSEPGLQEVPCSAGFFQDRCTVPGDLLNDGMHRVTLCVSKNHEVIYCHDDILVFDVRDSNEMRGGWYGKWEGAVRPNLQWNTEHAAADYLAALPVQQP
jgi:lipopolysaccharide transport system ATP-binding protein